MDFPQVKGRVENDYPLKKLNTWRVGGQAETVFWPQNTDELGQVVQWCKVKGKPLLFLGRGSNVLLPDQGFQGVVIVNTDLDQIHWQEDTVRVAAGYSLMRLAREAADRGLSGLEFACGIPGTVGAAIAINAGAYGEEIGNRVCSVKVLNAEGSIETCARQDIHFGYRTSSLFQAKQFVLESTLSLQLGEQPDVIREKMRKFMEKRKMTQPLDYPNAGSVFRNPSGDSAGRLIEQAGWKGRGVGDAQVSQKHANFIVNTGNAKSEDILTLIQEIQRDIQAKFGIELQLEVRVIMG